MLVRRQKSRSEVLPETGESYEVQRALLQGAFAARGYRLIYLGMRRYFPGEVWEVSYKPEDGTPAWSYADADHLNLGLADGLTIDGTIEIIQKLPDRTRRGLPVGTKSLLWGSHQFVIHPLFVAAAWCKLNGFPWDPRVWVAFFLHDIGYWGLRDMDGPEGIEHPARGAKLMGKLFDRGESGRWFVFTAMHSRSYARLHFLAGLPESPLMRPDKLATAMYPAWLFTLLCRLSGEWVEYRDRWVAAGTYPGKPDDNARQYGEHLQARWQRFYHPSAIAGEAYGKE